MERLRLGHEIWEVTRDRLAAYLVTLHPDWPAERIQRSVADRLLHEDIYAWADRLGVRTSWQGRKQVE